MEKLIAIAVVCYIGVVAAGPVEENDYVDFNSALLDNTWKGLNVTELENALRQGHPHAELTVVSTCFKLN